MSFEIPNFGTPGDTMVAVVMGALLATAGGFPPPVWKPGCAAANASETPGCCWARSPSPLA